MEPTVHRHPARLPRSSSTRRRRSVQDDSHEIVLRTSLDADGQVVVEEIPLTLEILLNPREDDHVPQGNPHSRFLYPLALRLQRFFERRGGWGVFSDLIVHWPRKDLRSVAPDVTVVEGIADPEAVDESLDVAAEGCRVRTVFEVVTTRSKKKREKDEVHNKPLFAAAGVDDYVLLYPAKHRKRGDRAVRLFTLAAGVYQEQRADAEGRFALRSLGLWLSAGDSEELVLEDMTTGERILTPKEEEERRRQAERQAAEEAAARQAAEQARQAAERRAARLLVSVLENRGLTLDAQTRRRILDCNDPRELERWTERAFTVATVEDLWDDLDLP